MVFCGEYVRERPRVSYDRTFLVRLGVALLNKSDSGRVSLYQVVFSGNAHAFWHACLRHFVQCPHHGHSLRHLTIIITQRQ
ncbi:hypothetical protein D0884_27155 (plasmid) [Klebsiella pneumoniae]|nr:hypothetical protein D0884_27155 [Klebsiella pneumoniae]